MAREFVPVFVDTLRDDETTARFHENPGSYPVLRILDLSGRDIVERLDGNPVLGKLSTEQVMRQLMRGMQAFGGR